MIVYRTQGMRREMNRVTSPALLAVVDRYWHVLPIESETCTASSRSPWSTLGRHRRVLSTASET